jgi:tetratricopeptide (TPR) repeat protein/transcriptional regulator with XRE-family HTH domain
MDTLEDERFGTLLKTFRIRCRLNQQGLADKIRKSKDTISGWERCLYLPNDREIILKIATILDLTDKEADRLLFAAQYPHLGKKEKENFKHTKSVAEQQPSTIDVPSVFSPIWTVPHKRNPYFTGRETLLEHLHSVLSSKQAVAVTHSQAISGLGGVGKTQIVLEYAYQHYNDYKAVFWVHADSRETSLSDFVSIASLLNLPEKAEQDRTRIVKAVKSWFHKHTAWLLILDNVDDLATLQECMPTLGNGSILITSRMQSLGNVVHHPMKVDIMGLEAGMLFLLRRAGILSLGDALDSASEADRAVASTLVEEMGGLPLALDQAGAYIEETGCSLSRYLHLYKRHRAKLLKRRGISSEYPQSVAATWSLSFQKIEKDSPIAVEMLLLCAFLHPDAIPEDIFLEGKDYLGLVLSAVADDPFALDETIDILRQYSLVNRNAETRTLSIHRLVQAVLQDSLTETERMQWVHRLIFALDAMFPASDYATWKICGRLISHVQSCETHTQSWKQTPLELASLLFKAAGYLQHRAQYEEAEQWYQRALHIWEQELGPEHSLIVPLLNNLALLYWQQGKYEKAESLYQRALYIVEQVNGPEHPLVTSPLNGLARLSFRQGKYTEAEQLYQRVLHIRQQAHGPEHHLVASPLYNLALLYHELEKYEEAELLYQQSLRIWERSGPEHPDVAYPLNGLAALSSKQGKYEEAELLYQRVLHIWRQALNADHPNMGSLFHNMAELYYAQGKFEETEQICLQALRIREQALGSEHPDVAYSLNTLAGLYRSQGRYTQAEPLYRRAQMICEQHLGLQHPQTATIFYSIAIFHEMQDQDDDAVSLYKRALYIREQALGLAHPKTNETRKRLCTLLEAMGETDEAAQFAASQSEQTKVDGR